MIERKHMILRTYSYIGQRAINTLHWTETLSSDVYCCLRPVRFVEFDDLSTMSP